ncbi:MAG: class I SAM-dependent methyltransferase [Deltaproteobacteria bacterium]|nr:class I SAM-dependent methyltransferase [Deltaproteobacteria bacterium]MBW2032855.1 class I SAM-dependent methyltransferase [Deltaproteobacteria bacterium]
MSRDILSESYFESTFSRHNILTRDQFERACLEFDACYSSILPKDKNSKILDVGCGAGHFLYYLEKKGYKNHWGIDVSGQQVEFCEKYVTKRVSESDATTFLEDNDSAFDLIVVHDVLEHIPKDSTLALISSVWRSLKSGGRCIVRVPNMSNPFSLDSCYRDFTHETGFTDKSLFQIMWSAGFRTIEMTSSQIHVRSLKNRFRRLLVRTLHQAIRFLFYIQDYSVPDHLGKNLICVCKK